MATTDTISPPRTFAATNAAPVQTPAPAPAPAVLEEPRAGGNYLRDAITGALTLNPAHVTPSEE